MLNILYKCISIPVGLGLLGWMLFLDKEEGLFYRLFGLLAGIAFLPLLLIVGGYLILEDMWDQWRNKSRKPAR